MILCPVCNYSFDNNINLLCTGKGNRLPISCSDCANYTVCFNCTITTTFSCECCEQPNGCINRFACSFLPTVRDISPNTRRGLTDHVPLYSKVQKRCNDTWLKGKVSYMSFIDGFLVYRVTYQDGDAEDLTESEVRAILSPDHDNKAARIPQATDDYEDDEYGDAFELDAALDRIDLPLTIDPVLFSDDCSISCFGKPKKDLTPAITTGAIPTTKAPPNWSISFSSMGMEGPEGSNPSFSPVHTNTTTSTTGAGSGDKKNLQSKPIRSSSSNRGVDQLLTVLDRKGNNKNYVDSLIGMEIFVKNCGNVAKPINNIEQETILNTVSTDPSAGQVKESSSKTTNTSKVEKTTLQTTDKEMSIGLEEMKNKREFVETEILSESPLKKPRYFESTHYGETLLNVNNQVKNKTTSAVNNKINAIPHVSPISNQGRCTVVPKQDFKDIISNCFGNQINNRRISLDVMWATNTNHNNHANEEEENPLPFHNFQN